MGRKGGGRKGFLKAAGRGPESDEAENAGHSEGGDAGAALEPSVRSDEVTLSAATDAPNAPSAEPATAAAEPDTCRESDEGDEDAKPSIETQGQVMQRHKRQHRGSNTEDRIREERGMLARLGMQQELKAHKEAAKRLGKKKKDEMAQVEKEMLERHALELRAVEEAAAAAAAGPAAAEEGGLEQELQGMRVGAMGPAAAQRLKPSKAQRRREKLAQAEAERGERIAQELAMLGETEGQREEAALRSMLAPQGLVVQDIQADGHCLYRALEHQLSITGADEGGSGFPSYQELRALAARWIRQHPDDFLPYILDHDSELDAQQQLESYCATLEGSAAWGGQLELTALAAALQRPIHVHSAGMPLLKMGAEHEQAGGPAAALQLCYQRHAFSLGEHYSSVVPVSLPSAGAAGAAGDGD